MKTKPEIKEKLEQATKLLRDATGEEEHKLASVVIALRWVLDQKITTEPKDPVAEE